MTLTVGQLWSFPVKSMLGHPVEEILLGPAGVIGDRAYGFVDVETEHLVSAKHPRKYGAILECSATFAAPPRPDAPAPEVTVTFPDGTSLTGDGEAIAARLSALFGREVRMVTAVEPGVPYEEIWPELEGFGPDEFYGQLQWNADTADADGERILGIPAGLASTNTLVDLAAMHVLATSTLATLAAEHPEGQWDIRRFRPNILLDDGAGEGATGGPYGETAWYGADLLIGDTARIHVLAPTPRCVMTTLHQRDLPKDAAILRTIAQANQQALGPLGNFACAGAYAEVVTPGVVRVGDPVQVLPTIATESALADAMQMLVDMQG